jgi:hypothetical protein
MKARREGVILNNIGNGGENFDFNTVDGGITSKRSIT